MIKVLIVEDDLMIADMIEQVLDAHGYDVCGIARTVDAAVDLARFHLPNLLLLDLRLADGRLGTEIPAQLGPVEGLGILYATGNRRQLILTSADGHAALLKPYRPHDLVRGLEIVSVLVKTGTAPQPFPNGFELLRVTASETENAA